MNWLILGLIIGYYAREILEALKQAPKVIKQIREVKKDESPSKLIVPLTPAEMAIIEGRKKIDALNEVPDVRE